MIKGFLISTSHTEVGFNEKVKYKKKTEIVCSDKPKQKNKKIKKTKTYTLNMS